MEPMGIERHRWESREAKVSGSERVKITEDVRKYAAENAINEDIVLEHGLREKAAEFQHSGAEVYAAMNGADVNQTE
jgi:hypothetical protein